MTTVASEIIGKLMEELRTIAKTETILGKEIQVGEITLIPVSKISLGVGSGGASGAAAKKEGEGGGGGGGVMVTPVAIIVIKGGELSVHNLKPAGALSAMFEQLPEVAERILARQQEAKVQEEK